MTNTWVNKVRVELLAAGFILNKREDDGHWELSMDGVVHCHARSMGDVLRKAGNEFKIGV